MTGGRAAHLAQVNVSTLRQPIDHSDTAPFVEGLGAVNAAGESAPGFVWRLADDSGDATSIALFPDPLTIVNLTVWTSIDALREFAFSGIHRDFLRRRVEWFVPGSTRTALWWLPAGTLPQPADIVSRLAFVDRFGDSPHAFQFSSRHDGGPMPQLVIRRASLDDVDVQRLIFELNAELHAEYPEPGANHFTLDPHEVAVGAGGMFVAMLDDLAVGCGAYRLLDDGRAEVKRMYVGPPARGLKVGAALVDVVASAAAADGATSLVLETGPRSVAAVELYRKFGFEPCDCWGEYLLTPDSSLCMSMAL